jgi:hypothetical protein
MTRSSRLFAAAFLLAFVAGPAGAQFAPEPDPPAADADKSKKGAATPPARASGPDINGTWIGELTQVGTTAPYKFEITLGSRGMETKYPDLNCAGKLSRVGSSRSYVFFVELITQGHFDKGGRCPDGTITVARSADKLAVGWFGAVKDSTIVAYGTLSKK